MQEARAVHLVAVANIVVEPKIRLPGFRCGILAALPLNESKQLECFGSGLAGRYSRLNTTVGESYDYCVRCDSTNRQPLIIQSVGQGARSGRNANGWLKNTRVY